MEVYDKFLMCFSPKQDLGKSDLSHSSSSEEEHKDKKHKKLKEKLLDKHAKTGVLHFDERKFREIRYGFVASTLKASVSQSSAILIL